MTKLRCFYKRERDDISPFLHIFSLQKHEDPKWGWNWAIKRPHEWFTEDSTLNDFYPERERKCILTAGEVGTILFAAARFSLTPKPRFLPSFRFRSSVLNCLRNGAINVPSFPWRESHTRALQGRWCHFPKGRKLERSLKSRERCRYKECRTTI